MKIKIDIFRICLLCALSVYGCDLQPKLASIPDDIGMFIQNRYPALLADPVTQPEIYNSAVTDYGVYASPELYGSENTKDYVLYASVDDYVLVPQKQETSKSNKDDYLVVPVYGGNTVLDKENTETKSQEITVARGDTVYSLARKNNLSVDEFAKINDLHEPYTLSVGQKLKTQKSEPNAKMPNVITKDKAEQIKSVKQNKRVDLQEITVVSGDTLYSISRKYEIPVNDLAVMNKLTAPFTLSVGQKIKVPALNSVKNVPEQKSVATQTNQKQVADNKQQKISSDPTKQLPKISSRSASKFSWPVRGNILSQYGAKNHGLFNDGINISASRGTAVKAAENGVVAYAGNEVKGMGNLIIIQHSDGWMTVYAHMDSMAVKRGHKVSVGQQIGTIGMTGKVDKPQLHFEIRRGTKAYNPIQYLKK